MLRGGPPTLEHIAAEGSSTELSNEHDGNSMAAFLAGGGGEAPAAKAAAVRGAGGLQPARQQRVLPQGCESVSVPNPLARRANV